MSFLEVSLVGSLRRDTTVALLGVSDVLGAEPVSARSSHEATTDIPGPIFIQFNLSRNKWKDQLDSSFFVKGHLSFFIKL
jgi:hypothetical protein